ncbi:hypothetical protein GA0070214_103470 [Micromonospora chaiyaphumensis]|uniref:Uncharacterized protein n=1 Tax=Micromonospora chaiyaphumensis TaxID=307119 RepID=A0A1C4WDX3_9ACTN|nr:hypothetical protein GA0070214_103470 [Micromonospora chaiyaphumensis]
MLTTWVDPTYRRSRVATELVAAPDDVVTAFNATEGLGQEDHLGPSVRARMDEDCFSER